MSAQGASQRPVAGDMSRAMAPVGKSRGAQHHAGMVRNTAAGHNAQPHGCAPHSPFTAVQAPVHRNWSVWLDLNNIARTFRAVVFSRNAY